MARTKNRYIGHIEDKVSLSSKVYMAGIYTRLSQDRKEEYRDKSNSLVMQEKICIEKAKDKQISIVKVYQDYEYSGTSFKRPAFLEMMEDIRSRKINCIIVKDLSRFGREYLEIANYIEKVFPFLGVRFISVNDGFDTESDKDTKKSFELAVKNIINDMYAKDISKKVKATKEILMKQGFFAGTVAPYGYKVERKEKGRVLVIDENVESVVKLIFNLALEGKSNIQIARELTKVYTTPSQYKKTNEVFRDKLNTKQWDASFVSKILSDEVYIGNLIQRVRFNKSDINRKCKFRDKKDWIITENTHKALIEKEIFEKAKRIKQGNLRTLPYVSLKEVIKSGKEVVNKKPERDKNTEGKYDGLIKCGCCGRILKKNYQPKGSKLLGEKCYRYYCNGEDRLKLFGVHVSIYETDIDIILVNTVKRLLSGFYKVDMKVKLKEVIKEISAETLNKVSLRINAGNNKTYTLQAEFRKCYENYVKGDILLNEFCSKKEVLNRQIKSLESELKYLEGKKREIKNRTKEIEKFIEALFQLSDNDTKVKVDKSLVDVLIDHIEILEKKQLLIHFRFDLEQEMKLVSQNTDNSKEIKEISGGV